MPRKPKTTQKRLPRNTRAKTPPRFQLMPRDVELVRSILKYRFLYVEQLGWLFAGSTPRQLAHRLKLLYHGGFVERVKLPVTASVNKLIYSMTEKGAQLLAEADGVGRDTVAWTRFHNQVTPTHVAHLLEINDVMISYELALTEAKATGDVLRFRVDRGEPNHHRITVQLRDRDGHRYNQAVVPDIILRIIFAGEKPALFFIEVDRGTMTTRRWQDKVVVYREYMQSPKLEADYKTHWFIQLTVTTSDRRIATLAEATAELGGRRGFWFTTSKQVSPQTALQGIWVRASDLYELRNEKVSKLAEPGKAQRVALAESLK